MIERKYSWKIKKWLRTEKILILKGARQVGKTTILKNIEKELQDTGEKTVFLNADDLNNENIFKTPADLIYFLELNYGFSNKQYLYLFIDEFQYIKQAGLFLKNIFDKYKENLQIIVSVSSSLDITKNKEFLTGRHIEFFIDRVSFKEYFTYKKKIKTNLSLDNFVELKRFYQLMSPNLDKYFLEYLSFGGYPEVIITKSCEDKLVVLSSIFKTYIEKDIVSFLKIENVSAFNSLVKILSAQKGSLVNKSELASTLRINRGTIDKYLNILKGTFIFNYLTPYYSNVRKELTKMPKVFVEDLGVANFILGENLKIQNKVDIGDLVENFVYKVLQQNNSSFINKLHFYQTLSKAEIDFVLEKSISEIDIFEVKYRHKVKKPLIFNNFEKNYQNILKKKFVITKDLLDYKDDIYFIPASLFGLLDF